MLIPDVPYGLDVARFEDPKPLPSDYRYEEKEYTVDGKHCTQPDRPVDVDPANRKPARDRVGLGQPTDNPFFADIYIPSALPLPVGPSQKLKRVRIFVHGGFMQFGCTSGYYNQSFFYPEETDEVFVLLGYRLSVLGLLGCEKPAVSGNFAFKDIWLGLEWVRDNIAAFGGDPADVHLSGLSGGGHLVHQILHRAAQLSPAKAPFQTVTLLSNAILTDPFDPAFRNEQFALLAEKLDLDPSKPGTLETIRDPVKVPSDRLVKAVFDMGTQSTFRAVVGSDGWCRPDQMAYQHSGQFARDLKAAGVKCIIMGDVLEEWGWYSGQHVCREPKDILPNAARWYPIDVAQAIVDSFQPLSSDPTPEECDKRLADVLAAGQVHLPIRILARDLINASFPVVRYTFEKAPVALNLPGRSCFGILYSLTISPRQSAHSSRGTCLRYTLPALPPERSKSGRV